jgi:membrane protein required for colicin V production
MPPWVFDVVVVAIVILSAVMSIGRGLIRETFSILAFIIGGISAYLCISLFQEPLGQVLSPDRPSVAPAVILFLVGFLVAYVLAAFLGARLSKLFNESPEIGLFDRLAGALLGVVKGVVACVLFIVLLHQVVPAGQEPPEIAKSQSYPLLDGAAGWIGGGLSGVIELFTGPADAATTGRTPQ